MGGSIENTLNDLNGSQWLYWTDTVYITDYPPDSTHALRKQHGAMKPPEVMAEIIRFFTKQGELVLDPMAGVGGTLLGAALAGRRGLGFELDPRWVAVYHTLQQEFLLWQDRFWRTAEVGQHPGAVKITGEMLPGDCLELLTNLENNSIDAIITDPPYGCHHGATGFAAETNFNMLNRSESRDFGNASNWEQFLELMAAMGQASWRVLRPGRYLVLLVGDRYHQGEFIPLGYRVADTMRQVGFKLKGIKLWSNKATRRPLKPYAVKRSFVPNITHQNIIILRKE